MRFQLRRRFRIPRQRAASFGAAISAAITRQRQRRTESEMGLDNFVQLMHLFHFCCFILGRAPESSFRNSNVLSVSARYIWLKRIFVSKGISSLAPSARASFGSLIFRRFAGRKMPLVSWFPRTRIYNSWKMQIKQNKVIFRFEWRIFPPVARRVMCIPFEWCPFSIFQFEN